MTNQIEAFIRFHPFSAFCPIFNSFCLIACLPNAGPPISKDAKTSIQYTLERVFHKNNGKIKNFHN